MTNTPLTRFVTLALFLALSLSCTPGKATQLSATDVQNSASRLASPSAALEMPLRSESTQPPTPAPTPPYASGNLAVNILLGRPTADSITANLYAQTDLQVAIAYGTVSGSYTEQTKPIYLQANRPQNIELIHLSPNTTYYYQVITDGTVSEEHTFHTQRAPGSTFTFTIDADPHNRDPRFNSQLYANTLTNARNDHPDFHINLGDTFMTEKAKPRTYTEAESTFAEMRPYFGLLGGDVPLFLVNGNHEGEQGWLHSRVKDKDLPIWSTQLRQIYYPNPLPNDFYSGSLSIDPRLGSVRDGYYAWTWGDALLIALDPFWYTTSKPKPGDLNSNWGLTLGKEQYDWLQSTLEASNARFKLVFIHHLVGGNDKDGRGGIEAASYYEWGGKNADGSYGFDILRPGWGIPIHQLLVDNHVSAVFHGHDHVFVKQDLDGIVYQELPQSSNAAYNNTRLAADYGYLNGDVLGSSGHLRVTVSPYQITIEYIRAYLNQDEKPGQLNGQTDYVYTIQ